MIPMSCRSQSVSVASVLGRVVHNVVLCLIVCNVVCCLYKHGVFVFCL